jgi:site-specific DNA-methyltransferase (adenine-specific)
MIDTLMLRDEAQKQLAQITTVESGVEYLNKVKAIETWAKAEKKDAILQNAIAEQKLRTQKILGDLIRDGQKRGQIKTQATAKSSTIKELDSLGINKKQSSTFQKIASMPEELFEKEIAQAKDESNKRIELTTSRLLKAAKQYEKETTYKKNKEAFEKPILKINKEQEIIEGDSRNILKTLNKKSYDLLLSDPPYGMDFKSGWNTKDKIQNDKIEDTVVLFEEVLKECVPLLKDDAHFYLFGNINYLPQIKPIIEKYLTLKNILIWDRQIIGMGDLKSYGNSYDIVYFGYNKKWKDLNGTRDRDILNFQRVDPAKNIHPTEKPLDMLEYLIKKSSQENDKILEPFAGGGSTLVAAKNTNRKATGIEIEDKYVELIKERI